jgi:Xaa-Pro aminopeptidase
MVISDEPGIYREGKHGIRHENLLLCKELGTNEFGSWLGFETLTLCHIDTSAIIPDLLTGDEIEWLNDYNERVYRELGPRLPSQISAWLREKTRPVRGL